MKFSVCSLVLLYQQASFECLQLLQVAERSIGDLFSLKKKIASGKNLQRISREYNHYIKYGVHTLSRMYDTVSTIVLF